MSDGAYERMMQKNREKVSGGTQQPPPPPGAGRAPPPPPPPGQEWGPTDDLSLADAYAQLALAIRRGDTKRAAELQDHINSLLKRKNTVFGRRWDQI